VQQEGTANSFSPKSHNGPGDQECLFSRTEDIGHDTEEDPMQQMWFGFTLFRVDGIVTKDSDQNLEGRLETKTTDH